MFSAADAGGSGSLGIEAVIAVADTLKRMFNLRVSKAQLYRLFNEQEDTLT